MSFRHIFDNAMIWKLYLKYILHVSLVYQHMFHISEIYRNYINSKEQCETEAGLKNAF